MTSLEEELLELAKSHPIYGQEAEGNGNGHSVTEVRQAAPRKQISKPERIDYPANLVHMNSRRNRQEDPKPSHVAKPIIEKPKRQAVRKCVKCKSSTTYVHKNGCSAWHREAPKSDNFLCQRCYVTTIRKARKKETGISTDLGSLTQLFDRQDRLIQKKRQEILDQISVIEKEKTALLAEAQTLTKQIEKAIKVS